MLPPRLRQRPIFSSPRGFLKPIPLGLRRHGRREERRKHGLRTPRHAADSTQTRHRQQIPTGHNTRIWRCTRSSRAATQVRIWPQKAWSSGAATKRGIATKRHKRHKKGERNRRKRRRWGKIVVQRAQGNAGNRRGRRRFGRIVVRRHELEHSWLGPPRVFRACFSGRQVRSILPKHRYGGDES